MKSISPILALLLLACFPAMPPLLLGQVAPTASISVASPAEQTLQAAIAELERYETLVAKVRHRATLFGKQATGSGTYVQGPARYNLTRLELKLQVDDKQSRLLEICDGKQLWSYRDLWGKTKLTRIDAARVLASQEAGGQRPSAALEGLDLGGLPRLLAGLARSFRFTSMQETALGSLPVRVIAGHWHARSLVSLLPDQEAAISTGHPPDLSQLPGHIPDEVLIYLGRDDLFPYRIEYRATAPRAPDGPWLPQEAAARVLLTLEFYDVRVNSPVDPLQFVYNPGDWSVEDRTDEYLSRRGF